MNTEEESPSIEEKLKEVEKQNRTLQLQIARYKSLIKTQKSKINRIHSMKTNRQDHTINKPESKNTVIKLPENIEFQEKFVNELVELLKQDPKTRSYSDTMYDLCFCIYHLNPKTYRFLRNLFPLPSEKSIYNHFSEIVRSNENKLTDIERASEILQDYRAEFKLNDDVIIPVVVGLDACSFDRITAAGHKYAFCFYIQPIHPEFRCFPIHLISHEDGKANPSIITLREKIVQIIQEHNFEVVAQATDGDNAYNFDNEITLDQYIDTVFESGIEYAIDFFADNPDIITVYHLGDMLHILKLARARLLTGIPITFSVNNAAFVATIENMEKVLKLGAVFSDKSATSKMKDFYPIKLFTLDNVDKLMEAEMVPEALYLLPFALWATAILVPNLKKDTRKELLSMAFSVFYSLYMQSLMLQREKGINVVARKNSTALYFEDDGYLIRAMNATFTTAVLLQRFENVALDRIGTHVLENFFGNVRMMCCNYDSYTHIISSCAKSVIINKITSHYNIKYKVTGRVNIGGVKVKNDESENVIYNCPVPIDAFGRAFLETAAHFRIPSLPFGESVMTISAFKSSIKQLTQQITQPSQRIYEPGPVAAMKIKARCAYSDPQTQKNFENKRSHQMKELIENLNSMTFSICDEDALGLNNQHKLELIESLRTIDSLQEEFSVKSINTCEEMCSIYQKINHLEKDREEKVFSNSLSLEEEHNYNHIYDTMLKEINSKINYKCAYTKEYFNQISDFVKSDIYGLLTKTLSLSPLYDKYSVLWKIPSHVFQFQFTPFDITRCAVVEEEMDNVMREDMEFINNLISV